MPQHRHRDDPVRFVHAAVTHGADGTGARHPDEAVGRRRRSIIGRPRRGSGNRRPPALRRASQGVIGGCCRWTGCAENGTMAGSRPCRSGGPGHRHGTRGDDAGRCPGAPVSPTPAARSEPLVVPVDRFGGRLPDGFDSGGPLGRIDRFCAEHRDVPGGAERARAVRRDLPAAPPSRSCPADSDSPVAIGRSWQRWDDNVDPVRRRSRNRRAVRLAVPEPGHSFAQRRISPVTDSGLSSWGKCPTLSNSRHS